MTEDIKNKNIYYSLEGYLFPDTYRFNNREVTTEEIFTKMLDEMDKKLSKYKDEINEWIKNGFRVAIYIDDSFKYDDISNEWLTIFDYIITNGEYGYDFDRDKIISIGK